MAIHLCHETFTGETPTGPVTYHAGVSVLDSSKSADAALLKLWGKFFTAVETEKAKPQKPLEDPDASKK